MNGIAPAGGPGNRTRVTSIVGALVASLLGAFAVMADEPALHRLPTHFATGDFSARGHDVTVFDNAAFTPSGDAGPAAVPFTGVLALGEATMRTEPRRLAHPRVMGRDVRIFPAVRIAFLTVGADLVPATQDVIRVGSEGHGRSYWDILIQPGRVWSAPGDGGWSRAAFPFALVHSLEGETHNGYATFLYRDGTVSNLRFQVVQQTAPFYVSDEFVAAGSAPARFEPAVIGDATALARTYQSALADDIPLEPWSALEAKVGPGRLADFDRTLPAEDRVALGLDYEGSFYLKYCTSVAGPMPWCDRLRFGVWSATKALANETALLRLAQKYGDGVFDAKIRDYVPEAAGQPGWQQVRFSDAINMATGIGNGTTQRDPNDSGDGYLDRSYGAWYEARSAHEKVAALLQSGKRYPWGPNQVTRYRDQDMFVLGVAMDGYLKSREGPSATLWSMLENEVFGPIGIHYAPTNRTLERDGHPGQPLMAYGYYPTLGDMIKIARLYQRGGITNGVQILHRGGIEALSAGARPRGLPTGETNRYGEATYFNAFWHHRFVGAGGCRLYVPAMSGWGGNIVLLMPHQLTALRIARSPQAHTTVAENLETMLETGDRLAPMCD